MNSVYFTLVDCYGRRGRAGRRHQGWFRGERLVEPVAHKRKTTSPLAQELKGARIINTWPVVRRGTPLPAATEPSSWQLAVDKIRRKYRSYITEMSTADELPTPMRNVHNQLPGQGGSVALHRMRNKSKRRR